MAFVTAVGAGGIMLFSQLVTVGVIFLIASVSGLSGYILRARQERVSRNKQALLNMLTRQADISVLKRLKQQDKPSFFKLCIAMQSSEINNSL